MVVAQADVDRLFHALADATRRDIVRRTLGGSFSVSTLARDYPMSFAAVQKHVAVLELIWRDRIARMDDLLADRDL
jgi:DNA-binding transcriptional ArsR family regulator